LLLKKVFCVHIDLQGIQKYQIRKLFQQSAWFQQAPASIDYQDMLFPTEIETSLIIATLTKLGTDALQLTSFTIVRSFSSKTQELHLSCSLSNHSAAHVSFPRLIESFLKMNFEQTSGMKFPELADIEPGKTSFTQKSSYLAFSSDSHSGTRHLNKKLLFCFPY
jgi:hypothetical protein